MAENNRFETVMADVKIGIPATGGQHRERTIIPNLFSCGDINPAANARDPSFL